MNTKVSFHERCSADGAGQMSLSRRAARVERWLASILGTLLVASLAACGGGGGGGGGFSASPPTSSTSLAATPPATAPSASTLAADPQPEIPTYKVGGTVSGLAGTDLVLANNDGDDLAVGADGAFVFRTALKEDASYAVTVKTHPSNPSQTCTVNNGRDVVHNQDINTVSVICAAQSFVVGGNVSGLQGTGLILANNGDELVMGAGGNFVFPSPVATGAGYAVTVKAQPSAPAQICTVSDGSGKMGTIAISDVQVVCSIAVNTVGGTVRGLAGPGLGLLLNGADALLVNGNGTFSFPQKVAIGANYAVTVSTNPTLPSQICTASNATGQMGASNVTSVVVTCATQSFKVGGTVTGLEGKGLVLVNNGGDDLPIAEDGSFTFSTPVASGTTYKFSVKTQPKAFNQTCLVSNGFGAVRDTDVSQASVHCTTNLAQYLLVGTSSGSGLPPGVQPFHIDALGNVSAPSPFGVTASSPTAIGVSPDEKYVYVADSNQAYQFSLLPNGQGIGGLVNSSWAPLNAASIQFDTGGKSAFFVSPISHEIDVFSVGTDGSLLVSGATPTGSPHALNFESTGRFAYVANTPLNTVSAWRRNASSPTMTYLGGYPSGVGPSALASDPVGKYLYVGSLHSPFISVYTIDQWTGQLVSETRFAAMQPRILSLHPKGEYLYTIEGDPTLPGQLVSYAVDPLTGALTKKGALLSLATTPATGLAVDSAARFVAVLSAEKLELFGIDAATGALSRKSTYVFPAVGASVLTISR